MEVRSSAHAFWETNISRLSIVHCFASSGAYIAVGGAIAVVVRPSYEGALSLSIADSAITSCSAGTQRSANAGGICLVLNGENNIEVSIRRMLISGCSAEATFQAFGGAMYLHSQGLQGVRKLKITDSIISTCRAMAGAEIAVRAS